MAREAKNEEPIRPAQVACSVIFVAPWEGHAQKRDLLGSGELG